MKCINCGAPTKLGAAYALPFLILTDGHYQNLYACSESCRADWLAAQRQVKQIQAEYCARFELEARADSNEEFNK
ncbi:MAG: hypothetical protein BroJett039_04560 [Chloroflexota bacterium]|nr:MAG: hypothetical protein BroJett039_04560 [Chloroflexota bacterium]